MKLTYIQKRNAFLFIFTTLSLVIITGFIAFKFVNEVREKNGLPIFTFKQFLNNGNSPSLKTILIGMLFGLTFGFIDNTLLLLGVEYLGPIFNKIIPGNFTNAGLANTYGDFLGSSFGTFLALIFKSFITIDNIPIWADCLGITIGCLFGLYIPSYLYGKT